MTFLPWLAKRFWVGLLVCVGMLFGVSSVLRADHVLIFSQFVAGGDFISSATFANVNFSQTVTGTFSVFNPDGTPRSVAIDGRGTSSTFAVTIPPGGTVVLNTSAGGTLTVGMAKFVSNFPAGGVVRFRFSGGQVGVPSSPVTPFATLLLNTADGNDTGVAITNPGTSPINIRLIHAGDNGQVIETIDPPELNPLAPNGQVVKFITQFTFTTVANRSSGSIQIQVKTGGAFAPFALLLRGGALSSTAIIIGTTGRLAPEQYHGSFTGTWNNTTFGSTGGASLNIGVIQSTNTALARLTLTGNVFGAPNPAPTLLAGTFDANGFNASGNSDLFGPITMTITPNGTWTLNANNVPSPVVATFTLTGTARADRFEGNYTVTFRAGGPPAVGTIEMNHSGP